MNDLQFCPICQTSTPHSREMLDAPGGHDIIRQCIRCNHVASITFQPLPTRVSTEPIRKLLKKMKSTRSHRDNLGAVVLTDGQEH